MSGQESTFTNWWHVAVEVLLLGTIAAFGTEPGESSELTEAYRADVAGFMETFCVDCHGENKPEGDLSLHALHGNPSTAADLAAWKTVFEQLRCGAGSAGPIGSRQTETAPPKSPEQSRKCFQIEPGARIELFAAEPLVLDPVAIAFDRRGRMFVVEYADYPTGAPDGKGPLSRVVIVEDTDADGRADRREVFADGLDFAHSLTPLKDGILVGAKTEIVFLKDTDGDNIADLREVWLKGFKPAHPQMQIGNPRWGFDNWIYLNYGPGEITRAGGAEPPLTMPRSEFRFNPRTMEFGPASGLGQYDNTIDNWGRRFFCTNRNPIMTPMLPWSVSRRNLIAGQTRSQ